MAMVDTRKRPRQIARMRAYLALGPILMLAACSGSPASYGITGPGTIATPVVPSIPRAAPETNGNPGVSTTGTFYGPDNGPVSGPNGFYNYN